jgi:hypothetical protein
MSARTSFSVARMSPRSLPAFSTALGVQPVRAGIRTAASVGRSRTMGGRSERRAVRRVESADE